MLLLLTGIYVYEIYLDVRIPVPYTERVMGIPVVDNLDFLTGKESRCAQINPGVLFQQIQLPYAADGTLYLAQDPAVTEWVGEFSTTSRNTFLCMLPDAAWQDKAACIRENHVFELYLVEDKVYYPLRLVVCGMPVISITTDREEEQDLGDYETDPDRYYFDPEILYFGHIQIFDPINRAAELLKRSEPVALPPDSISLPRVVPGIKFWKPECDITRAAPAVPVLTKRATASVF